ncbi:DUF3592 domain-containing protein [Streptomyces sp. NRRL S-813]|uniref:DUF3592 domain-containing protein n=1 Tax=Streptomyces sp. NRRL S-813 TaxID=1463919 RepID=UPI0004BE7FDE|nr:DUF3592 domain-containing protein [Streptomyces sp. NRRL S-813]
MFAAVVTMVCVTVVLLGLALWNPFRAWRLKRNGLCVDGSVISCVVVDKDEDHYTKLTISFFDHDGRRREVGVRLMTTKPPLQVGARVPLAYRPGRPDKARLLTHTWRAVHSPLIFLALVVMWLNVLIPYLVK